MKKYIKPVAEVETIIADEILFNDPVPVSYPTNSENNLFDFDFGE